MPNENKPQKLFTKKPQKIQPTTEKTKTYYLYSLDLKSIQ